MEVFRTEISAPDFPFSIDHGSQATLIGSCFAENIGSLLREHKLPVLVNPFGILFNPFSIMNALERMLNNRPYTEDELIPSGEYMVSLDHHGSFNRAGVAETLSGINSALELGAVYLKKSKVLFLTLGSAWIYRHLTTNHIVANCHKIPNREFKKELLSFQDIHLILRHIPQFLAPFNENLEIVFTVSPIRHWKDGATENQRSKSILVAAVHEVVEEFSNCHYFPSYELMMDDLRDYRFYASDMLHPSAQAIDYTWQKFQQSFFSDETRIICRELNGVVQASLHRPMDPESNSFQRFVKKQLDLIAGLEAKYPNLNLQKEKQHFRSLTL